MKNGFNEHRPAWFWRYRGLILSDALRIFSLPFVLFLISVSPNPMLTNGFVRILGHTPPH